MAVRPTLSPLINKVRQMIFDPSGVNQVFDNQTIADKLDEYRDDIRYELLQMAPVIVNAGNTSNQAQYIWADYYSAFNWWEGDLVIQGNNVTTGQPWIVLTPLNTELINGHFQFQLTPFVNGTYPGQWPPVYCTGKVFDIYASSADLLEMRAAMSAASYDIAVDGQNMRRSQMFQAWLTMANKYRMQAKARVAHMVRSDVNPAMGKGGKVLTTIDSTRTH
jgi:hypothetical protein